MESFDVIVLGGGAAGLMCAVAAGQRGRRVLILEGSNKVGKKILMSGGGRCNFTNLNTQPENFVSANPHFCKSALSRYTPYDFVALVDAHEIPYHEKTAGQLFCDRSSKDILAMLLAECERVGVTINTQSEVGEVGYSDGYIVATGAGKFHAASLVLATGGLSIPKMGASDFGYRTARQFGLRILPTSAGLVPFTFSGRLHEMTGRISGISTRCVLRNSRMEFKDDVLFTHRGLSGPAALQLSSYWQVGESIEMDLLPDEDAAALLLRAKTSLPKQRIRSVLAEYLPRALIAELQTFIWNDVRDMPLGEIANERLARLAAMLHAWPLKPSGTEGYRTAEVTLGGIDTDELSSRTLQSKRQPGLFCIGEVVDVTGHLGGFNFQWAWASAQAAGDVV